MLGKFKIIFFRLLDKHIPKVKVKNEFQPPWFDSDCYEACRNKEKLRKKFKKSKSQSDGIKFSVARKEFRKLYSQKMNDNLVKCNDTNIITKEVFSYLKTSSKSHRIPESINYNGVIRNEPKDQAELFNTYFYDQFSEKSKYDIEINWNHGNKFDIIFLETQWLVI